MRRQERPKDEFTAVAASLDSTVDTLKHLAAPDADPSRVKVRGRLLRVLFAAACLPEGSEGSSLAHSLLSQLHLCGAERLVHLSDPTRPLRAAGVADGAFLLVEGAEQEQSKAAAPPPPFWRSPATSAFLPLVLGVGALVFLHSNLSATLAGLFKNADAVLGISIGAYGWVRPFVSRLALRISLQFRQFISKYFDALSEKFEAVKQDTKAQFEEVKQDTKAQFEAVKQDIKALSDKLDFVLQSRRWPWS